MRRCHRHSAVPSTSASSAITRTSPSLALVSTMKENDRSVVYPGAGLRRRVPRSFACRVPGQVREIIVVRHTSIFYVFPSARASSIKRHFNCQPIEQLHRFARTETSTNNHTYRSLAGPSLHSERSRSNSSVLPSGRFSNSRSSSVRGNVLGSAG